MKFLPQRAAGKTRPQSETRHLSQSPARLAGRSCCCTAKPAVVVLIRPSKHRRHQTDLLLCGHHYRASRDALATAKATILDLDGQPVTVGDEFLIGAGT